LVPERRQELTTEGGLDAVTLERKVKDAVKKLKAEGVAVSLFIEPNKKQIQAAKEVGADFIEIHTGKYANSKKGSESNKSLAEIKEAVAYAVKIGLGVNAGHGLDYKNVVPICRIPEIQELNIGYAIICRAVMVGLGEAVREMKQLIELNAK
jgi:pyridoxine 5-phosphate synthase